MIKLIVMMMVIVQKNPINCCNTNGREMVAAAAVEVVVLYI
jgi:hypothetical protein